MNNNKYKIVLYQLGQIVCENTFSDIESARDFYYDYDGYDYGIRLFVNNKPLKVHEAEKLLGKNPKWSYTIRQSISGRSGNTDMYK